VLRVLDLFSGIGGFSLGLERAGMRTVAFCEIDPFCRAVLAKHWPAVPIHPDVRALTASQVGSIDAICGGFPCQDISSAGKRSGIAGERSGLWGEYARLIGELRPSYAIVENVCALRSRGLDVVLGDLAAIGYDAEWHCIPASHVGAPHNRDRIWIVAYPERGERGQEPYGRALGRMGREQQSVPWDRGWQMALREFRGVDDGSAYRVHRVDAIRNSIVPQIAEEIGRAILDAETTR
jgi:DNA (cytosine-5)-methyltransferase 1